VGILRKWDERNQRVLERQNANMTDEGPVQPANSPLEARAVRWWERYEKSRMFAFAIVLFALVMIALLIFIASGF